MPPTSKIFSIPVSVDGVMVYDLFYAHGTSTATQVGLALAHPVVVRRLEKSGRIADTVEYIPTSYIDIITIEDI
jgi:hypothetical protein